MLESVGGRKFILAAAGIVVIFAALMVGKIDGATFTGGVAGIVTAYEAANIVTKKVLNGSQKTGGKSK